MTIWFKFVSLKMNAILKSTCNLCILQVSQGLSDLGNKIIRNKVWCILDISVNCLSSIQAEFRNLYDILQGESKILNWKQTKNCDFEKNYILLNLSLTHRCRCSSKMFAWPFYVSYHQPWPLPLFAICLLITIYLSWQIFKFS